MESYNDPIDPQDWENFKKCCKDGLIVIFWAIVLCMLICMCTSCTTTKYVPVESHTTDTVRITDISRDTLVCRDSIYVELTQRNDTIYRTECRDRWKYIVREKTDTAFIHKIDSIPVPYPVQVEVEKKLHLWQKALMWEGGIFMALLAVLFCVWLKKRW